MDKHYIQQQIDAHYFVMGRLTLSDTNTQYIREIIYATYPEGVVVSRETGTETGKEHYHFVVQVKKDKYVSADSFREAFRKFLKSKFDIKGNGDYSVKIATDPVNSVAYCVKDGEYEEDGYQDFFLHIAGNIHM